MSVLVLFSADVSVSCTSSGGMSIRRWLPREFLVSWDDHHVSSDGSWNIFFYSFSSDFRTVNDARREIFALCVIASLCEANFFFFFFSFQKAECMRCPGGPGNIPISLFTTTKSTMSDNWGGQRPSSIQPTNAFGTCPLPSTPKLSSISGR